MKSLFYLVLLLSSISAYSQVSSQESKKKLNYLERREKFLTEKIASMEDSLQTIQASLKAEQEIYHDAQIRELEDSIRIAIGKGVKMNTGKSTLVVVQDNLGLKIIGKKTDYVISGLDKFPIYFVTYQKKRYRINVKDLNLQNTQIYYLNQRLGKLTTVEAQASDDEIITPEVSTNQYTPNSSSSSFQRSPNHSQEVHTGPRGGKYVITASGKKRYVKKN